jgi:hypothetical protein
VFKKSKDNADFSLPSSYVKDTHEAANTGIDTDDSSTSSPKKRSASSKNSNILSKDKVTVPYHLSNYACLLFLFWGK